MGRNLCTRQTQRIEEHVAAGGTRHIRMKEKKLDGIVYLLFGSVTHEPEHGSNGAAAAAVPFTPYNTN